ncbi:hypothetical protein RHSIM_Rhsim07G0255500 [Rhododendron simsii]|uniref:Uncharacterized protein n=1 Tax=Rhododendron simsii TaxID=118357 RepID=A0A834LGT0_RHOSS|nr:hypothetical protein RHSIM_Rhsim07G0255500 [Rhododendron simsii]
MRRTWVALVGTWGETVGSWGGGHLEVGEDSDNDSDSDYTCSGLSDSSSCDGEQMDSSSCDGEQMDYLEEGGPTVKAVEDKGRAVIVGEDVEGGDSDSDCDYACSGLRDSSSSDGDGKEIYDFEGGGPSVKAVKDIGKSVIVGEDVERECGSDSIDDIGSIISSSNGEKEGQPCTYFRWVDDEICDRGKVFIPQLRNENLKMKEELSKMKDELLKLREENKCLVADIMMLKEDEMELKVQFVEMIMTI